MRFHFKQSERSLTEIKQLFRTLWIRALHGRIMLAPYDALLVESITAGRSVIFRVHSGQ
jgi:hypothetical protein